MVSLPAISQQDTLKKDPKAQEGIKRKVVIERAPAPEKPEPGNKLQQHNQKVEPKPTLPVPPPIVVEEELGLEEEIINPPEKRAMFPGGREALFKFIEETMEYPEESKEKGEQGKVYLTFVVEKNGAITNIKVSRGVSEEIDAEAVRILRAMPNWIPGEHRGKVVRSLASLPITFLLK